MSLLRLYHTGFEVIEHPDIHIGRRNADFGQGFYLTPGAAFAQRWARLRRGMDTWVNAYELDTEGLLVHRFERDAAWADYILGNRAGRADALEADAVAGPIANDTIYDTWGLVTSGALSRDQALRLLQIGPVYRQLAVKTDRAASQLRWVSARRLTEADVAGFRGLVRAEEADYQAAFSEALLEMLPGD